MEGQTGIVLLPGDRLEPDMGRFDEAANPWLGLTFSDMVRSARGLCRRYDTPDSVAADHPEVLETFLPFEDPYRTADATLRERAAAMAKSVIQMHSGLPRYLVVEATSRCHLSCPFCSSHDIAGLRRSANMDLKAFRRLWEGCAFYTHALDFTGGEPLVNPDLPELVRLARADGAYVGVSSNGLLLTAEWSRRLLDAGLSSLVISFDGTTANAYEESRPGGDFYVLCRNIREFAKLADERAAPGTRLGLRYLVTRRNSQGRGRFLAIAEELGADYALVRQARLPPDADPDRRERWLREEAPDGPDACYRLDAGGELLPTVTQPGCTRSRHPVYVGSGGEVLPCQFFPRDAALGNAVDRPLAEIWLDSPSRDLRTRMIRRGYRNECRWCPGVWRPEWYVERWFKRK